MSEEKLTLEQVKAHWAVARDLDLFGVPQDGQLLVATIDKLMIVLEAQDTRIKALEDRLNPHDLPRSAVVRD